MGKFTESDFAEGKPTMSRWHTAYVLAMLIGIAAAINASHVIHYWGPITGLWSDLLRMLP